MMENTSTSLSTRKRSVGVTILGYLMIALPIIDFIVKFIFAYPDIQILQLMFPVPRIAFMVIQIITGVGLLHLRYWASRLVTYIAALYIIVGIIVVVKPPVSFLTFILGIIGLILGICLNIFFTRPKVKALFSPERGETESKGAV